MAARSPMVVIHQAHAGIRRSALRRQLQSVASGNSTSLSVDLDQSGADVGAVIEEITNRLPIESMHVQRLVFAFKRSGTADRVVERLAAESPQQRLNSARVVGALRLTEAVPWVAALLESDDRPVSDAGARALGKIGGARSATALVQAIQRKGLNRRFVVELARAAPDLFVEAALTQPQRSAVRPALAIAAGLRRRQTAVGPLIRLMEDGSRRERVISCRALGWIGSGTAVPTITRALGDRDWKIRLSAAKALGALRAQSAQSELTYLRIDRNASVRKAAEQALYRLIPR